MQLLKAPEPFSPAFGEIAYSVSLSREETGEEISIFNSSLTEKIGIKKATEAPVFTFHVSDYVCSQINIEPFPRQDCGIIEASGRTWNSCIAYRDWASVSPHTAGVVSVKQHEPLTEKKVRFISGGEQDEICWIGGAGVYSARAWFPATGEEAVEVGLGSIESGDSRMLGLILNSDHLDRLLRTQGKKWDDFATFSVDICRDHSSIFSLEYRIRPHHGGKIRLGWWNRQGGIDFHSFEALRQINSTVSKNQIATGNGKRNLSAESRREWVVATAVTTSENTRWLAQITGAPQVWMEENGTFVPVEIKDTVFPLYHPEKTEIEIRFSESSPLSFPSF